MTKNKIYLMEFNDSRKDILNFLSKFMMNMFQIKREREILISEHLNFI